MSGHFHEARPGRVDRVSQQSLRVRSAVCFGQAATPFTNAQVAEGLRGLGVPEASACRPENQSQVIHVMRDQKALAGSGTGSGTGHVTPGPTGGPPVE